MKIIKYLFLIALVLLLGAATYIALLDSHFSVEKQVELKAPRKLIFEKVNDLKTWETWMAPGGKHLELKVSEEDPGHQNTLSWVDNSSAASGKLSTEQVVQDSVLKQKAVRDKNINRTDYLLTWSFTKHGDSVLVTLRIEGRLNYWAKIDRVRADDFSRQSLDRIVWSSLDQLKKEVLKEMSEYTVEVEGIKKTKPEYYLYRQLASDEDAQTLLKDYFRLSAELEDYIAKKGLKRGGKPFAIFGTGKNWKNTVSIAVPLADNPHFKGGGDEVRYGSRPAQHQVKTTLKGGYANIPELWAVAEAYMKKNGLKQDDKTAPYLIFKKTPRDSENPADWVTEIFIPLKEYSPSKPVTKPRVETGRNPTKPSKPDGQK